MGRIWKILTRKKAIDPVTAEETRLNRILNVFDLTALGVGSTLGVGIYVLAGQVAKETAGPSVVLSFLIAAIASVFAGLCYAEFGARAPRAGSAYIYSYVCVGEFIAFVIGWNLILEYVIGSASVARGLSLYLDTLINNTLANTFKEIAPINVPFLSAYFDFFSFGISILLAIGLAFGLKESSMVNNVVTCLNILVVLFIIIAGSLKANPANWHFTPNATTNTTITGQGGFFPWGVEGMIKGAATCFYGFVGFDCIATSGEEVKNPRKSIPISIIVSLLIIFLAYFGVATVLTLMIPYFEQDYNAPIPKAFEMVGWEVAKWIVAIGALFGLCASLFGAMFPLPRIIYAMGTDGLLFKFLAKVHPKFQTPVIGTISAGVLTGLMAALFDLSQLVKMMSIGTLQAYTIVAASVIVLRYSEEVKKVYVPIKTSSDTESVSSESSVDDKCNDDGIRHNFDGPTDDERELISNNGRGFRTSLKYLINCTITEPNRITENIVAIEIFVYCILCTAIGLCAIYLKTYLANGETWAIVTTSIVVGLTILVLLSLMTQPKSRKQLSFKVPCVPLIPALSILVNIYLMLMLDYMTWIRFAVWMAVGIPMYYFCTFIQKPLKTLQNQIATSKYTSNLAMANPVFVMNEPEKKQKIITKKKAPAPPPTIFEQPETLEMQQEAVIAQLDKILEKESIIDQDDDISNNETIRVNDNRKLSAGTLSNMSAMASSTESVVADVHCANVVNSGCNPKGIHFPILCNPMTTRADIPEILNNDNDNKSPKEILGLDTKNSDEEKIENINELNSEREEAELEVNNEIQQASEGDTQKNLEENKNKNDQEKFTDIKEPKNTELKEPLTVTLPPIVPPVIEPTKVSSPVPTEELLKTVTLKQVVREIRKIEPTYNQNASENNLRVGSGEYKNFIRDLEDRLTRSSSVSPTFYVAPKKEALQAKKVVRNENVVEEPIDQVEAKKRLKLFYASKTENPRLLLSSKSVDAKSSNFPIDNSFSDHKEKMESVFNSIKLKQLENLDDKNSKRKLSRSLGVGFAKEDQQSDNQQKIADLFKDIRAMRKE
ncbi:unnamed protein product [Ceutorhynchus assimilis]|uniref:Cationic amino acid transporter C-terminal domain-containing protein n=1 Tax=Ceutorhynchus assimilis TaxID=467358 RepID=A0A9N9QJV9_9CUCU|nr:unnamed protein product [Ceutorhynchus assimilis]